MTIQTSNITAAIKTVYEAQGYKAFQQGNVLDKLLSKKYSVDGMTVTMPIYGNITANYTAVSETGELASSDISVAPLTITPIEDGHTTVITNLAEIVTGNTIGTVLPEKIGQHWAERMDKRALAKLDTVSASNIIKKDATLTAASVMDIKFLNKLWTKLNVAGARPFTNGLFALVLSPAVYGDLLGVAQMETVQLADNAGDVIANNLMAAYGFMFMQDRNIATSVVDTQTAYNNYAMGAEALVKGISQEGKVYFHQPDSFADRQRKVGWYEVSEYALLNPSNLFIGKTVSASA